VVYYVIVRRSMVFLNWVTNIIKFSFLKGPHPRLQEVYTVQPEPSHPVYSSARAKSPSTQFSQSNVTRYTVQPEPSHPVYSSARPMSPGTQFSQSQVTQYTVQPEPVTQYTVQPEPSHQVYSSARASHPVYSSARSKSPSIKFS